VADELALDADIEVLWIHLKNINLGVAGAAQQHLIRARENDVLDLAGTQRQLADFTALLKIVEDDAVAIIVGGAMVLPPAVLFACLQLMELAVRRHLSGVLLG